MVMRNLSYIILITITHVYLLKGKKIVSYSMKPNLMQILERMNKVYTKNGDRINEFTD